MDFDFSREQRILRDSARDFLKKECPPSLINEMKDDPRGYPPKLWDQMADLGWMGVVIPEKYKGIGGSFIDLCILIEAMGEVCCPGPYFSTVVLGGSALMLGGSGDQKKTYLPQIAAGTAVFSLASAGSDTWLEDSNFSIYAAKTSDGYTLDGKRLFVENAHISDFIIAAAQADPAEGRKDDFTLFLTEAGHPGIACTALKTLGYDRQCEVIFDKVTVPESNVIGQHREGKRLLDKIQERAAVAKCAEMLGGIQTAFDMTVAYAKDRKQFGRPIGSFQAVQHHCANMVIDVDASRFITYRAAWKISEGLPADMDAAMAKAWAGAASERVTMLAHQIHGAVSFTEEYDVHLFYRRAKAGQSAFGDTDFYLEKIAGRLGI